MIISSIKKVILFVDNRASFLDVYARLLEDEGYEVIKALSLHEAYEVLQKKHVHLAILDLRIEDEDDPNDVSGLEFAQKKELSYLPKIILTAYSSYENVRRALEPTVGGIPPAVNFLDKVEGPHPFINAVKSAFTQYVHLNWDLITNWNSQGPASYAQLLSHINARNEISNFEEMVRELQDLFRKLFYDYDQITFSALAWRKSNRAALVLVASSSHKTEEFLVTYGWSEDVRSEQIIYQDFYPKTKIALSTNMLMSSETKQSAWGFPKAEISSMLKFSDSYPRQPDRSIKTTLDELFLTSLLPWYQQGRSIENSNSLAAIYFAHLGFGEKALAQNEFEKKIEALVAEAVNLNLMNLKLTPEKLLLLLSSEEKISLPNPTPYLYEVGKRLVYNSEVVFVRTPGIDIDTILVNDEGSSWLTDFGSVRMSPIWQDFVSLEADIRFQFLDVKDLFTIIEFEEQVMAASSLSETFHLSNVLQDSRKALHTVQYIRNLAAKIAGDDLLSYYMALLFYSARNFAYYHLGDGRTRKEVRTWLHRLLFISILCKKIIEIEEGLHSDQPVRGNPRLQIDEKNREVRIGDKRKPLSPTEYELLYYLYQHAGQLCTRSDILQDVFKYKNAKRGQGVSLLNTTVGRLRSEIEPIQGRQKYIITVRGQGYKLIVEPE